MQPAVFMDRDGTLNEDPGFVHRPENLELKPGVPEGLHLLAETDVALVVVTNQSGIARNKFAATDMHRFHDALEERLGELDLELDGIYWCPHYPDEGESSPSCGCRKPQPGMLHEAAEDLDLALERSFMIGDRITDVHAGQAVGCTSVLVTDEPEPSVGEPDYLATTFLEAARFVRRRIRARSDIRVQTET